MIRVAVVLVLAACVDTACAQTATVATVAAFNPDAHAQNAGKSWSLRRIDGNIRRFEVHMNDRWPQDGNAPKERSEVYFADQFVTGRTYRVAFKFMIEQGTPNAASWLTLAQIQSNFRRGDPGHSPQIAIEMKGDRMRIASRTSPALIPSNANAVYTSHFTDKTNMIRGRWYVMKVIFRLNPFGQGELTVKRDGQKIVSYRGRIGFVEPVGAYMKQGIYRARTPETLAVRFTNPVVTPLD